MSERIRYELLSRQLRPVEVASCQPRSCDEQLAAYADRLRQHPCVQHEQSHVRDGASYGDRPGKQVGSRGPVDAATDNGLSRAVLVDDHGVRRMNLPEAEVVSKELLAAYDHSRERG